MKKSVLKPLVIFISLFLVILTAVLGISFGAVRLKVSTILEVLLSGYRGGARGNPSFEIIWNLRVPRVLLALLVGGGLSVSGTAVQALFRNPLAEPYLLGVSGGAAFGASLFTYLAILGLSLPSFLGLPGFAFLFSLIAVVIVYKVAQVKGTIPRERLLLAGVALSFLFSAFTAFFLYLTVVQRPQLLFWLLGGFSRARWGLLFTFAPIIFLGSLLFFLFWRELNAFLMGEEEALSIGVPVETIKKVILAVVALVTGASVGAAGIIGFVGLMVPHISRRLIGGDHRFLLLESFLVGATLMVLCDLLARIILSPLEIPVGIVTSLLGVPFFLWLLKKRSLQ